MPCAASSTPEATSSEERLAAEVLVESVPAVRSSSSIAPTTSATSVPMLASKRSAISLSAVSRLFSLSRRISSRDFASWAIRSRSCSSRAAWASWASRADSSDRFAAIVTVASSQISTPASNSTMTAWKTTRKKSAPSGKTASGSRKLRLRWCTATAAVATTMARQSISAPRIARPAKKYMCMSICQGWPVSA
jgi:hypothetical protein